MPGHKPSPTARAFRWGQLLTGIEGARAQLLLARRAEDLLTENDQRWLRHADEILCAVEQRAWAQKDRR